MLRWRLLLGPVFVAIFAALCWLDWRADWPGVFLLPLALVASVLGAGELVSMFRRRGSEPSPQSLAIYTGVLITVLAAGAPVFLPANLSGGPHVGQLGWLALGLAVSLFVVLVGELRRYEAPGGATASLALSVFAIVYVGGLMGFMVQLRLLGMLPLVSLIAVVKMSDIGQYTVGQLFGRHKLAPRVSPGKTWEGAAGGVLFAIVTAWLVLGLNATATHPLAIVAFAIAVSAAGILGDLAESLIKRDAGVKDSSSWLPGFGGVLDLVDSLLGAAPVAYLFWVLGWVGP